VKYTYDESGTGLLRDRTVVGRSQTRFHWEGLNLYLEEEKSGSTWYAKQAYINQPSALSGTIACFDLDVNHQLDATDNGWFYHYDEAGNVILITDKDGNLVKQFEQDCWGNDLVNNFSNTPNIHQHQTNKYLDEVTGLYFFGARWYDPKIGRYISESPISPIDEEEYAYCGNDPINYYDNNGKFYTIVDKIESNQKNLQEVAPDVAQDSTVLGTGRDLIWGIEELYQNAILMALPVPDKTSLLWKLASPVLRFIKKLPILGKLSKVSVIAYNGIKEAKNFSRCLDDLATLYGATPEEIRVLIPKDWIKKPLRTGKGERYFDPIHKGDAIFIEEGWEKLKSPIHAGPYVKISRRGKAVRIPLKGNPLLDN
jgi:RHS repeat-associated protein